MQQLTLVAGATTLGFPAYLAITAIVTFALAWASWVFIERPAMAKVRPSSQRAGDIQPRTPLDR